MPDNWCPLRGHPALALLLDLAVLGQLGKHAIQVIRGDPHLLAHFRDGDPGLGLYQRQGLGGTRSTSARPAAPAPVRAPRSGTTTTGGPTGRGGRGTIAAATHFLDHRFELVVLIDERLELAQSSGDLPTDIV